MKPEFIAIVSVLLFTITCMIGMNFKKMVKDKFKELFGKSEQLSFYGQPTIANMLAAIQASMALREQAARLRSGRGITYPKGAPAFIGGSDKPEIVFFGEGDRERFTSSWAMEMQRIKDFQLELIASMYNVPTDLLIRDKHASEVN